MCYWDVHCFIGELHEGRKVLVTCLQPVTPDSLESLSLQELVAAFTHEKDTDMITARKENNQLQV